MSADRTSVTGLVRAVLRGPDGAIKAEYETTNIVVAVGKNGIADQLLATPTISKPSHMALGTGATAAAAGDTALGAEIDRNALSSLTRSANVVTAVGNWAAGDATNGAIRECGLFSQASGVDATHPMYARALFPDASGIPKGANDTLQVSWALTFG
jgi:hypothetical protein